MYQICLGSLNNKSQTPLKHQRRFKLLSSFLPGTSIGIGRGGQGWTGVDRGGQGCTGMDRGGRGWTGVDRGGQGWTGVDRGGRGWTWVDRGGQGGSCEPCTSVGIL